MFQYLIIINPLGFMYGSAGAFLSPENLVGRSGAKFPPDAATLSGLFFSANKVKRFIEHEKLRENLYVAGPFWAECDDPEYFYIPIPWSKIITEEVKKLDEWSIKDSKWYRSPETEEFKPDYRWQKVNSWENTPDEIRDNKDAAKDPWKYIPILHPKMKDDERHVQEEDGLFLENSVQMSFHKLDKRRKDTCLVYLSTHALPEGWYRFGGENHLVEISSMELPEDSPILKLLGHKKKIERTFALITPGVWGSTRFSYRYPQHPTFPKPTHILTDRPSPYRYRAGDGKGRGRLGRGRYAVPAGSVYVLDQPLNKSWWEWDEQWFPNEGYSLKKVGCGLCLPIKIEGVT
ncbi:type III-B CRISPR module-associated Cmr3 family protein [Iningainema tapete]|uniref:CRISPR-associated protein n=1 Tax=Iningainema tapete BLCC-T55 TaxID=2748662 RepID=A0A8J6XHD6_9CYAN|nr:type III-B CRISPR module-associated Cmr3 family protein [Iningainema tapete]MBD2772617.1 CRISPR-associated protein [Iningainema tapete BLCC-T55]